MKKVELSELPLRYQKQVLEKLRQNESAKRETPKPTKYVKSPSAVSSTVWVKTLHKSSRVSTVSPTYKLSSTTIRAN